MSNIKERLIGAITVMDESSAQELWRIVERLYAGGAWEAIDEAEPDEIDLQMIREAQTDPNCSELATDEEVRAVLG